MLRLARPTALRDQPDGSQAMPIISEAVQPVAAVRILLKLVEKKQPGLEILGKQAIDDDANQTGQMLAALWDGPHATFAGKATVTREVDAGLEVIEAELAAVITNDLHLNEPRSIKRPNIMKAKAKPTTIERHGKLYNEHLPQRALGHKKPLRGPQA